MQTIEIMNLMYNARNILLEEPIQRANIIILSIHSLSPKDTLNRGPLRKRTHARIFQGVNPTPPFGKQTISVGGDGRQEMDAIKYNNVTLYCGKVAI